MKKIAKFKSSLRSDHPLFKQLISNAPEWWHKALQFEGAYIDIRKDNTINIYYEGARWRRLSGRIALSGPLVIRSTYMAIGRRHITRTV